MKRRTFTLLDSMPVQERDRVLEALASEGPQLSELLLEIALRARKAGRSDLAYDLYHEVLSQEGARHRRSGRLVAAAYRALYEIAIQNKDHKQALRYAGLMGETTSDGRTRRAARRIVERLQRLCEEPTSHGIAHTAADEVLLRGGEPPGYVGNALVELQPQQPELRLCDVGGLAAAKRAIHRYGILPMQDPSLAEHFGMRAGGGILLYGPPGCGKTLLAQAAAGEMGVPLLVVKNSEVLHPLFGMAERNVSRAFEVARASAPCVLMFDEIDGIVPPRTRDSHAEHRSVVSAFLVEMDGTERNDGVLVVATTNAPELVDGALKRPGRFSREILVGRPDPAAREAIWRLRLAGHPFAEDIDLAQLVELSEGLTGADIAGAVLDAVEAAWVQSAEEKAVREPGMLDLLIGLQRARTEGRAKNRIDAIISERLGRELE